MTTTKTIAQLEDELQTIDAVIARERESEQRSSRTAWSRVPGLLAERDQVVAKIQLAREPQDQALQLAKAIVALRSHDTISIAHLLREALAAEAADRRLACAEIAGACRQTITEHWKPTSQKAGDAKFALLEKLDGVLLQRVGEPAIAQEGADHE